METKLGQAIENLGLMLSERLNEHYDRILDLHRETKEIRSDVDILKEKTENLEKQLKAKNVVINGLKEDVNEDTVKKVKKLFEDKMEFQGVIDTAFRIGKAKAEHTRPIRVVFLKSIDKVEAIKRRSKLIGTDIFINADMTYNERANDTVLRKFRKDALAEGKKAYFKKGKLVVNGRLFAAENGNVVPTREF